MKTSTEHPGQRLIPVSIQLRPRWIMAALCLTVVFLFVCSVVGQIGRFYLDMPTMLGFVDLFYLDNENSIPTWYQAVVLLACAILLAVIAGAERERGSRLAIYWAGLAIIFAGLSMDEVASLHERMIEPLQRVIGRPDGIWAATWIIPGIAFVALLGLVYARFLLALPAGQRRMLLLAAATFLAGAVGMEMSVGVADKETLDYVVRAHIEELLEMAGALILLHVLLKRLAGAVRLTATVADRLAASSLASDSAAASGARSEPVPGRMRAAGGTRLRSP